MKDQKHAEKFSIYNGDCMEVIPQLDGESADLIIYSPPFMGLFAYSSDPRDMSNNDSKGQFLTHYEFLVEQLARVLKKGRVCAVHCMDLLEHSGRIDDFPHELIEVHKKHGFDLYARVTIWKEPLKIRLRTMVQSLMHKFIMEDSTKCFPSMPDYILIFKKRGENAVPVTHVAGMNDYAGAVPILPHMVETYNNANGSDFNADELWEYLKKEKAKSPQDITKLNHYIWQRYASAVWDDVRNENVLPFRDAKEEDDEKHIHPLQLDVIDRLVELYSNPGEIVLTPFMGVGSEVYGAVRKGRKGIGVELKTSYYKQAVLNVEEAARLRDEDAEQLSIF